jgi:hypothetical protein
MVHDGHTMRPSIRASTSARAVSIAAALSAVACTTRTPNSPPKEPPARQIVVTEGRVSLRTSPYIELHTWLAAAAKTDADIGLELAPAKSAYVRSLANDDADELLERSLKALSTCSDDRCAMAAVAETGFGYAYARALPVFLAKHWLTRAEAAWAGIEASHAALGVAAEAIFARAAGELGVAWPDRAIAIDVVSEAPPPARAALLPVGLATSGTCFARAAKNADARLRDARVVDCLLVRALLDEGASSPLRATLVRELGPHDGARAWSLLVVHVVAAIVTGWEPNHVSAYRRSAAAAERDVLEWLAHDWRASAEPHDAFAARYVARWQ